MRRCFTLRADWRSRQPAGGKKRFSLMSDRTKPRRDHEGNRTYGWLPSAAGLVEPKINLAERSKSTWLKGFLKRGNYR
jgi:hypothetical protein